MFVPTLGPRSSPFLPLTLQFPEPSGMCKPASGFRALPHAVPSVQDTFPLCDYLPNSCKYFETQTKRLSCLDCSLSGLPWALGCKLSKHLGCLTPVESHVDLSRRRLKLAGCKRGLRARLLAVRLVTWIDC